MRTINSSRSRVELMRSLTSSSKVRSSVSSSGRAPVLAASGMVANQKSEVRNQKSEVRSQKHSSVNSCMGKRHSLQADNPKSKIQNLKLETCCLRQDREAGARAQARGAGLEHAKGVRERANAARRL